jgi:transcriptional regulator with XRE-family HTH domain
MAIDEDRLYQYIGERLRDRRLELGLTQQDLARLVDLNRTSITGIERGTHKTPLHVLYLLLQQLKLEPEAVLPKVTHVRSGISAHSLEQAGKAQELGLNGTALFIREVLGVYESNRKQAEDDGQSLQDKG